MDKWDVWLEMAFRLGLSLEEFDDYTPRLLYLRMEAYRKNKREELETQAAFAELILNQIRGAAFSPKNCTHFRPGDILGKNKQDNTEQAKALLKAGK